MPDFVSSTVPCGTMFIERPDPSRDGWYFAKFEGYNGELYYNKKIEQIACNADTGTYGLFPAKESPPTSPVPEPAEK
jgi:hypothetical protein